MGEELKEKVKNILVRSGEIEKRFGKILSDTRELRENSDYGVSFEATEEEA